MSEIKNWQEGFDYFLRLAKKNGVNPNKDSAALREGLKEAAGEDGILSFDEAKSYFYSSSEMAELEDEFMDAFEAIAKSDGVYETISMEDLSEQTAAQMAAQANAAQAGNGGGGKKGGGTTPPADAPANTTPPSVQAVSADSLKDKSTSQLQSERQGVTSALATAREQKAAATEQYEAGVETAQAEYDTAVENMEALIESVEAGKEQVSKEAEKVSELSDKRDALTGEIDAQKATISETETNISNLNSQLGSLKAPVESDYQKEETYTDANGVQQTKIVTDTAAYNAALQAYEAQKQELEQQIADAELSLQDQEEALTQLETQKTEVEQQHFDAMEAWCKANKVLADGESEASQMRQALTQEKGELAQVKSEKPDVAQFDANIAQLRDNLEVYSDVILEQENPDIPEGYKIEDGKIVEENPPEGATPKELNSVTEDELKAELGEGVEIAEGDDTSIKVNGEIVGQVTRNEEGEVTGYFLFDNAPSNNTFDQNYALAQELFNGYTPEGKGAEPVSAEEAMANFDFTGYSQEDIESIGRMYDQMVADYNETAAPEDQKATFEEVSREAIANQLVNGYVDRAGNEVTPEQVWASFDFKDYSKEDIQAIETLYNEKVAKEDAFKEKANEEVLGDELAYINSAIDGTEYVDMSTLSGYLESKGIDIETTSPELISMYSRTYLAEKTNTQVTLNDSEIAEVANMLKNSNDIMLNGEELTPKDLWSQHDFAQYSPQTIAKIANVYNEGLQEGDKNFLEMVEKSDAPQEQFDEVVAGVIASGDEKAIAMVTEMVDEALAQADDGSLDFSILESITKAAEKYPEYIQNYIEDSGLAGKIEASDIEAKIPAEITDKINEIKDMHIVSYENQQLIDKLNVEDAENADEVAEAEEAWKNLDIEGMTPDELQDLQRDYDSIHGEGSFMDKAAEVFGKSTVDSIYDAISDLKDTNAALSNGQAPSDIAQNLNEDNFADIMGNFTSPEDIAKIASNYPGGVEAFMEEYTYNFGDGQATEYTQIREKIASADQADATKEAEESYAEGVNDAYSDVEKAISDLNSSNIRREAAGLELLDDGVVYDAINTVMTSDELTTEQKFEVLQKLSADPNYQGFVKGFVTDSNYSEQADGMITELLSGCETPEQAAQIGNWCKQIVNSGLETPQYDITKMIDSAEQWDKIIEMYCNATPEEMAIMNEAFDINKLLSHQTTTQLGEERELLLLNAIYASKPDATPTILINGTVEEFTAEEKAGLINKYIIGDAWYNNGSNATIDGIMKAYSDGKINKDTAAWLIQTACTDAYGYNPECLFNDAGTKYQKQFLEIFQ